MKEDQYFDSGVCLDVLGLDFSFGLTGKVLVKLEELGSAIIRLKKEGPSHLMSLPRRCGVGAVESRWTWSRGAGPGSVELQVPR